MQTKTPKDIDKYAVGDVYKLVTDGESAEGLPSPKVRLRIIKMIFDILGYDLSSDLALALCTEPRAQLVLAVAGGGKTTGAQLKAVCEKLWRKSKLNPSKPMRGNNILCLVYNKHNVKPMIDKHRELVNRLRLANIKGFEIDEQINASTMHSFCDQWRKEYVAILGLMNYTLLDEGESERMLQTISTKVFQKYNIPYKTNMLSNILALHSLAKESMCKISDLQSSDKFIDLELEPEVLEEISDKYEELKKMKKKYDFTDMLVGVYKLFIEHPEILKKVQRYYDYVIADEIQDFTPIMLKILKILVSDGTPLMCIGDDDQSIYKFRGADIYHTLHFSEEFTGGEVYLLSRNRRCRENILELGRRIIGENKLRYEKQMRGIKDGGLIEYVPYNSLEGENINLVNRIKGLPEATLSDSVVCYRERASSIMLTELLEEHKIPFNVIGGYGAFSHELYNHVIHVLNLLEAPLDPHCLLNLYKCTPMKKAQVYDALNFNANTGRFRGEVDKKHFSQIDFGSAMNIKGLDEYLIRLTEISNGIQKTPMIEYFDELFGMIKKFFWNFTKSQKGLPQEYDDFIEEKIYKIFNSDKTYPEVFANLSKRKEFCRINQQQKYGITISTFHGLKGLEFSNVYIMDLDNEIFPNFNYIDSRKYDEDTKQVLKECETCLYYVAVTRAKDELYLYYNETNPSRYVTLYNPEKMQQQQANVNISEYSMDYLTLFENDQNTTVTSDTVDFDDFDPFESDTGDKSTEDVSDSVMNIMENTNEDDDDWEDVFDTFEEISEPAEKVPDTSTEEIIDSSFFQDSESSPVSGSNQQFNSFMSNLLNF